MHRHAKYLVALSALVVLVAVPAQSAVAATRISLWVSSSGTNAGNCHTKTTPCATVTYALTQAPSTGTNINLLTNVADEVNINKDNITIQSSPTTSHFSIRPTTDTLTAQTPEGANVAPIVYVGPSRTGIALKNIAIDGSGRPPAGGCDAGKGHTGLYVRSAQVFLTTTDVVGVTQGPGLTGCQNGGAIYVRTDTNQASNVKITGGVVNTYDKNGITCNSVGTTCVISKTVVTGRGAVGIGDAAQNGIQFGFGATGSVTSVAVTGNNYTPDGEGTGILLYNAGTGVSIKSSNISGNNVGIYALWDGSAPAGQTTANLVLASNKVHDAATAVNGVGDGIDVDSLSNATVSGNKVWGNSAVGIGAYGLHNSAIKSNAADDNAGTATGNGDGIFVGSYAGAGNPTSVGNNVALNKANANAQDGIHATADAANNVFYANTMNNDSAFEAHDESTGSGTAGTNNTWTSDHCVGGTSSPIGLCH
jgi:hypothetical protein